MRRKSKSGLRRFQLDLVSYGNSYYIERIAELERALARKPRLLQLEMVGDGEIPAGFALLIRSVLIQRAPRTRIITNARSSLQGGAVLVWLMGDSRIIREDAWLFFRRADVSDEEESDELWKGDEPEYSDSYSEIDPDEIDYARVLELINEFLPVDELVGRPIRLPVLRQFGLVENEEMDQFLAAIFRKPQDSDASSSRQAKAKRHRAKTKMVQLKK